MPNINVETKGPKGPQIKESLLPATLTCKRGLAVVYGADAYHAALVAAAGVSIIGVIEEDAISLQNPVAVIEFGPAVLQVGGAVAAGADLAVNATGQFVTAAAGNKIVAKALEAGTNAGDFICGIVYPGGAVVPAA